MLTERRQKLLQFIIDEYVSTAQPVGSNALAGKYGLGVSSATIRSEMAHLEEEGYIAQPHTSAGRVPTDLGYRYYVEALMREEQVPPELQHTIRHQFHQAARELEEWARLAAAIMAARLNNAAVVTTPHSPQPRLRWLEIVGVHDYLALLVVVLQEARVLQQTLALERPFSQEELTFVARKLNDLLAGKTAAQMKAMALESSPVETAVVDSAATMLQGVEETDAEPSFLEGMRDLLRQPEFTQGDRILGLIENLEERNLARAIPLASDDGGAVRIIIGGEHPVDALRVCSVITAHYTGPAGLRGTLSVVGPTRMHYARAVSTVRYMSSLMAELLGVYFA
ncbi:MAG TPA: heat-inducible transcriptional repressor HrcA [Dehalococcoidia bacterium]|nr:heat-inducible transcriptional repressor HrcA [Dehalococcoidia bacterium]